MSDPNLVWLAVAFGAAWVAIGAYLVRLVRAQREIDRKVDDLTNRGN